MKSFTTSSSAFAIAAPAAPRIVLCAKANSLIPIMGQCSILPIDTAIPDDK